MSVELDVFQGVLQTEVSLQIAPNFEWYDECDEMSDDEYRAFTSKWQAQEKRAEEARMAGRKRSRPSSLASLKMRSGGLDLSSSDEDVSDEDEDVVESVFLSTGGIDLSSGAED